MSTDPNATGRPVLTCDALRKRTGEALDRALAGEIIIIERHGRPIAAIVPMSHIKATQLTLPMGRRSGDE